MESKLQSLKSNSQQFSTINHDDPEHRWKSSMTIQPKDPNLMKLFLIKRINDEEGTKIAKHMIKILNSYKTAVYIEENCVEDVKEEGTENGPQFSIYREEEEQNIDLLIIIGGDGSILWGLQYFHKRITPPILAFSKGTLNYLCNFSLQNYETSLRNIMDSIYAKKGLSVELRSRIHCEIINRETQKKRTLEALNEISLDRGCSPQVVKLNCYLEGKYFATFEGDGVLVATPTGSTAYQLSAGGPILNHLMSNIAITPISPLNLSTRPVVLPPHVRLTFKLPAESRKHAFLGADGQIKLEISKETDVEITTSKYHAIFILGENQDTLDNWISRLRNLLGWNRKFQLVPEDLTAKKLQP